MSGTEGAARTAYVTIGAIREDGTVVQRRWRICACCADRLAETLGAPMTEVLATADAVDAVATTMLTTPGIVMTAGEA